MEHEHHQWLAEVNKSIVDSYERDQEMARQQGLIQRTGHRVESRWDQVLKDWLPPQYAIGKRKYLLLEIDNGPTVTAETDLVVFHPHYPENLRVRESVLASGIAAAFSVRRTIDRDDIKDAFEAAITLRRGMKVRDATIKSYLVPPVFFGLLGESHGWKSPGSTPKENIKSITDEFGRGLVKSPREGLDFICVADLGTWDRVTTVLPERFLTQNAAITPLLVAATGTSGTESIVLTGLRHSYDRDDLSPLTNFVGSLWSKLSLNDPSLKPLADGLRITETPDLKGSFGFEPHKLSDVTTEQIARSYRNHEPFFY